MIDAPNDMPSDLKYTAQTLMVRRKNKNVNDLEMVGRKKCVEIIFRFKQLWNFRRKNDIYIRKPVFSK